MCVYGGGGWGRSGGGRERAEGGGGDWGCVLQTYILEIVVVSSDISEHNTQDLKTLSSRTWLKVTFSLIKRYTHNETLLKSTTGMRAPTRDATLEP